MEKEEKPLSDFEKIMQLNKLGALFLSGDKYEKAQNILKKTLQFYIEKKEKKEIPNFFYSILYCNLAKITISSLVLSMKCVKNALLTPCTAIDKE